MVTVPRTAAIISEDQARVSVPLDTLHERPAYVLLGEPGAGKTTAFKEEEAQTVSGQYLKARDFIGLEPLVEWRGKTLFIDGLDEMRAGTVDGRTPLHAIANRIQHLGRPRFRLSCREADWWGDGDRETLSRVAPGDITVVHLDPLSDGQIAQLLKENHGVTDPRAFLEKARQYRLDALLGNPETLRLLTEAVAQGWPDSLTKLYERACRNLVVESNRDHRDAWRGDASRAEDLLDAAGHGCAVLLLSDSAGFAFDRDAADAAHPELGEIGLERTPALRRALGSRLFASGDTEDQVEPAHRRIAEFLAARFLACRIADGLPLGRVLALLTGDDGGVVSALRGLFAWLAVHGAADRRRLIGCDPLSVVLYGDPRGFATADKRYLLDALTREVSRYPWLRSRDWEASPFGALASPELTEDFRAILASDDRDTAQESLLDCVLQAITYGEPLPALRDALLAIIGDASHRSRNRQQAVEAYAHVAGDDPSALRALLDDIRDGRILDADDELAGALLRCLYPEHVPPACVIDYLHPAKDPTFLGEYWSFWNHDCFERTKDADLPEVLDRLVARVDQMHVSRDDFHCILFLGKLLATGLERVGESVAISRVWDWLGVGTEPLADYFLDSEHSDRIAKWLTGQPEIYSALLRVGVARLDDGVRALLRRFHGAEVPAGAEETCFALAAANEKVRHYLFNQGARVLLRRHDFTPALRDALLAIPATWPSLRETVNDWLQEPREEGRQAQARWEEKRAEDERQRIAEWIEVFRKHQSSIERGTAAPGLLGELGKVYLGRDKGEQNDAPHDRLQRFFGDEPGIAHVAIVGLRNTLSRPDLPAVDEIIRLHRQGSHYVIADACFAGIADLTRDHEGAVLALPKDVQERLVAFRLTRDFDSPPPWYRLLVRHRPDTVAEVLIAYVTARFQARKMQVASVYALAQDEIYAAIARLAATRLLSAYPVRGTKEGLADLRSLLKAALRHVDPNEFSKLVATRLSRTGLDVAQRGQWLCAGLLLEPARYEPLLVDYIGKRSSRALEVAGFFASRAVTKSDLPELAESTMAVLIRMLAPHVAPERLTGVYRGRPEITAAEFVRTLLARLGSLPTETAGGLLDELLHAGALRRWHEDLRYCREAQRLAHREAHFRRASAGAVVKVLANTEPANAADLRALLEQHLRDLAGEDREGNTTGYRRYWNVDGHGQPEEPRPENDCRYRLLELLRSKTAQHAIDLQPEGQYRENTRADIRASFGGCNIPIEIKRDCHRDLWTALRKQLIGKYVRDPGADRNGIYLVFWFGGRNMPSPTDGGKRPRTAEELEERLRALLSPDERQRIAIIVMDCAREDARG